MTWRAGRRRVPPRLVETARPGGSRAGMRRGAARRGRARAHTHRTHVNTYHRHTPQTRTCRHTKHLHTTPKDTHHPYRHSTHSRHTPHTDMPHTYAHATHTRHKRTHTHHTHVSTHRHTGAGRWSCVSPQLLWPRTPEITSQLISGSRSKGQDLSTVLTLMADPSIMSSAPSNL